MTNDRDAVLEAAKRDFPVFLNVVKMVEEVLKNAGAGEHKVALDGDLDIVDGKKTPCAILENLSIGIAEVNFAKEGDIPNRDDRIGFIIQKSTIIPGKMYMSNGDPGYPDDVDVDDLEVFELDHWFQAASAFCRYFMIESLEQAVEGYGESLHAAEWADQEAERLAHEGET